MILKRGWQVVSMVALSWVGCAGDLKDPGRFAYLYDKDGSVADSGTSSGMLDGGGSKKDAATTTSTPAAAPACVTALFKMKCGSIGCHASGGAQVDLVSANVERRLVGQTNSKSLECKGMTLVSPTGGDSLLIKKITSPPPCGSLMPVTGSLTDPERTCLTSWVSSVADSN
jgi:hypothetical protein